MVESLEPIPELEPGVADLLEAFKRETAREPAQVGAALQSVTAKLAAPAAGVTGVALMSSAAKFVLVGVVLGGGAWWATKAAFPEPQTRPTIASTSVPAARGEPEDGAVQRPAPEEHVEAAPAGAVPSQRQLASPDPVVSAPMRGRTTEVVPVPPARPVAQPRPVSLAAELRLLTAARSALRSGEAAQALARVREHRASYPHSTLAEERDATEVMALCALGRSDEARTQAAAYERRFRRAQEPLLGNCPEPP